MNILKVTSSGQYDLKAIIEAALQNEVKLMEAGIRKTQRRLKMFENKYQKNTTDFLNDYENDRLNETMDFMEWVSEFRMMKLLQDKQETIRNHD